MENRRFPASDAHRLDIPERLIWLPPAEVIAALALRRGETVADLGAGTGYFSLPLAHAVGAEGKVYAVDVQPEMLARLRQKIDGNGPFNIETVAAEADRTPLPDSGCTRVFLANVWHEFPDRTAVLREAARLLAPGGRIAILDWRPDVERQTGPPLDHRLTPQSAADEMAIAGFLPAATANVGLYSWLLQGEKPQ
ncbi:MAG: class I SAM-dependent methyltransferase [Terracidiphilus sp.]